MNANARVIELLRTIDDARVAWEAGAAGGGASVMPSVWNEGSYQRLEEALVELRDSDDTRRLWWHASFRYRYVDLVWVDVPVRKTVRGPVLVMPARSELVARGSLHGERRARVRVRRWSDAVDDKLAAQGVRHLAWLLRDDPKGIHLPAVFFWRSLGIPLPEERKVAV